MADQQRPTTWFVPSTRPPFVIERHGDGGPPEDLRVLEISSRSRDPLGRSLSAMFLKEPQTGHPVESVYQAAKCYGDGGPADILDDGFRSKIRDRDRATTGQLKGFDHDGMVWPAATGSQFYDRLWMTSARAAGVGATEHDAFTDMFHRPGRAMACQARSMAMMQGMIKARCLGTIDDPVRFSETVEQADHAITSEDARDEIRVVISGSPKYKSQEVLYQKLDEVRDRIGPDHAMRVIHGDRPGLDRMVRNWAAENGVPSTSVSEDWNAHPKSAGYVRNEQMLLDHDAHLVVMLPDYGGKGPRHLLQQAQEAELLVEAVIEDGNEWWNETENGKLADLGALATELGRTQLVEKVAGPGPLGAASLRNGDPRDDGEIRVVIAPGPGKENEQTVRAKLENLQERSQPAALRLAISETSVDTSFAGRARRWAGERGIHCDMYLHQASGDDLSGRAARNAGNDGHRMAAVRMPGQNSGEVRAMTIPGLERPGSQFERMLAEQEPHIVLSGRTTAPGYLDATERAGIPIEMVTAAGWTRTSDGELPELASEEVRFRGEARPTAAAVKPYPGRSAKETAERLETPASEAEWSRNAKSEARSVNVRDGLPPGGVRVDRKTEWGNPFPLPRGADNKERESAIESYRQYLAKRIDNGQIDIAKLAALSGKPLGCHCAPNACHADVLADAADWAADQEQRREKAEGRLRAEQPDLLVEEPASRETLDIDDIPPWDGSEDLEPDEAAAQHAWQPGVSDIEPLNRRREALIRRGATDEEIQRYDDAVWEFEEKLAEEKPSEDRPEAKDHPLTRDIQRAEVHLEEMRQAGGSEKALERMGESIETVRQTRDQEIQKQHADLDSRGEEVGRILEKMSGEGGPLRVAAEIDERIELAVRRRPRKTPQELRPIAPPPAPSDKPTREVRVLVCGSQNLEDANLVRSKLDSVRERIGGAPMRLVTSDGRGAEHHAVQWAAEAGVPAEIYEADWDGEGKSAGYKRNDMMLTEADAHVLVAFPQNEDSPLAEHVIAGCNRRDVPIETVDERGVSHTSTPKPVDLRAMGERAKDTARIAGASIEELDPIEYAARISVTSEMGVMDDAGNVTERLKSDAKPPVPSPAAATGSGDNPGSESASHSR